MIEPANPVLVEVLRGDAVESRHRGAVTVADAAGRLVASWGDIARPVHPRSALKPVQALPLVRTGALERFGLGMEHLALACASHSGTPDHTGRVAAWLERIGLSAADLECGAHPPYGGPAGTDPTALHNNCSGKHAGFLTVARALGVPTAGYVRRDHPVQVLVSRSIEAMTGCVLAGAPCGLDGCGIPAFALPLTALAAAMARLAAARDGAEAEVVSAMRAHPRLVAGPGRADTAIMEAVPGIVTKGGAEGVHAAILPAAGLGIAVKIDDGAGRAAEVALLAVLDRLGLLDAAQCRALAPRMAPPVLNVAGRVAGGIRAVLP